ncbi:hypothetical protein Taro_007238, partial [Colocasia esculenta]|nr:hypothetical protein [Colocasia esculenta]
LFLISHRKTQKREKVRRERERERERGVGGFFLRTAGILPLPRPPLFAGSAARGCCCRRCCCSESFCSDSGSDSEKEESAIAAGGCKSFELPCFIQGSVSLPAAAGERGLWIVCHRFPRRGASA